MVSQNVRPLADQLRPTRWEDFQGVESLNARLIESIRSGKGRIPSLILWGPPGSGKTSLAKLIGSSVDAEFVELSAVLSGVKEVREVVAEAATRNRPTLLFLDEIHRFNKSQQDAFLPHIESGAIALIGATTENPSFYLTGALLSRCTVVPLAAHSAESLSRLIRRGADLAGIALDDAAVELLASVSGGDARRALNLIEDLTRAGETIGAGTREEIENFLRSAKILFHDRSGEEHYNVASAFIKSLRGSNPDAALIWGFRMIDAGEDPRFVIRRLMIFASEDIGNADPRALQIAVATAEAYDRIGLPEGRIPIAQCITYLASAPKSNRSYVALNRALELLKKYPRMTVPMHLRNAPTGMMKQLGYGEGYQYPHETAAGFAAGERYFPTEIKDATLYEPSPHGYEKTIGERFNYWHSLKTGAEKPQSGGPTPSKPTPENSGPI